MAIRWYSITLHTYVYGQCVNLDVIISEAFETRRGKMCACSNRFHLNVVDLEKPQTNAKRFVVKLYKL